MEFLILAILIILAVLLVIYAIKNKENMDNPKTLPSLNIFLMGDYQFHQPTKQNYPSLEKLILKKYPLSKIKVNKYSMIKDVDKYIETIPKNKYNNNKTIFILAIGSNDIYKNLLNCSSKTKVVSDDDNKLNCNKVGYIFNHWKTQVSQLTSKFDKANIIILGSYLPKEGAMIPVDDKKLKANHYLDYDLDYFNSQIMHYSESKKNVRFINMFNMISQDDLQENGYIIKNEPFKKLLKKIISEIKLS